MRQVRSDAKRVRRRQAVPPPLPLDPRDPDVVRAKALGRPPLVRPAR